VPRSAIPSQSEVRNPALTTRLAAANTCRLDALPANRAGLLSPAQQEQLQARLDASRRSSLVPTTCCVLALAVLVYGVCTGNLATGTEASIGLLAAVAGWLGLIRPHYGRLHKYIDAGRVTYAEGQVTRERDGWPDYQGSSESCSHYYVLGGKRFLVSGAGYAALVEGRSYRIYYLPDAPTDRRQVVSPMVNIELVPGAR